MTGTDTVRPHRPVLVTYASKMGGTCEIAEVVGSVLGAAGRPVTVLPVDQVADPSHYDAVVHGSALYFTRWRPEAVRFLRRHRHTLAHQDVWLFQSGPCGAEEAATQLPAPRNVRRICQRIGAEQPVTFGGRLDPSTAQGPLARRLADGELAGDWRDWQQIRIWASALADRYGRHG